MKPKCERDKALRRGVAEFDKVSTLRAFNRLSLLHLHEDHHIHSYPKLLTLPSPPSPILTKIPIAGLNPKSLMPLCRIHATIAAPPKRFFNTLALLVGDDAGDACRLLLHNTTLADEEIRRMYPQGGEVVIKEPMVDNFPEFDGVMLVLANPDCLELVCYNPSVACRDAGELKELGNAEFKAGCFEAAAELYTKCVSFACKDVEKVVAYSNRAEANLMLGRYEEALADAEAALRINPRHAKSCSRKARVLAAFHRYVDACGWFEKTVEFSVGAAQRDSARVAYEKCRVLMLQSVHGSHDLRGYVRSGFDQRGYAEGFAEYVGPVEVMRSELGRGLLVTRDVQVGELLLVCNGVGMGAAGERPPQNDRDCMNQAESWSRTELMMGWDPVGRFWGPEKLAKAAALHMARRFCWEGFHSCWLGTGMWRREDAFELGFTLLELLGESRFELRFDNRILASFLFYSFMLPRKTGLATLESEETALLTDLEIVTSVLSRLDAGSLPPSSLFVLLRIAVGLEASVQCRDGIEKMIGLQLHRVKPKHLICSASGLVYYDVEMVERLLRSFIKAHISENKCSLGEAALSEVARLVDGYLVAIATDPELHPHEFIRLVRILPNFARITDDDLYCAVDLYLKAHPQMSKTDTESLCGTVFYQRLSIDLCLHMVKNARFTYASGALLDAVLEKGATEPAQRMISSTAAALIIFRRQSDSGLDLAPLDSASSVLDAASSGSVLDLASMSSGHDSAPSSSNSGLASAPSSSSTWWFSAVARLDINMVELVLEALADLSEQCLSGFWLHYLVENSGDPHNFIQFARSLLSCARITDDDLYHAVDVYLKAHRGIKLSEVEALCDLVDFEQLSVEASIDIARNPEFCVIRPNLDKSLRVAVEKNVLNKLGTSIVYTPLSAGLGAAVVTDALWSRGSLEYGRAPEYIEKFRMLGENSNIFVGFSGYSTGAMHLLQQVFRKLRIEGCDTSFDGVCQLFEEAIRDLSFVKMLARIRMEYGWDYVVQVLVLDAFTFRAKVVVEESSEELSNSGGIGIGSSVVIQTVEACLECLDPAKESDKETGKETDKDEDTEDESGSYTGFDGMEVEDSEVEDSHGMEVEDNQEQSSHQTETEDESDSYTGMEVDWDNQEQSSHHHLPEFEDSEEGSEVTDEETARLQRRVVDSKVVSASIRGTIEAGRLLPMECGGQTYVSLFGTGSQLAPELASTDFGGNDPVFIKSSGFSRWEEKDSPTMECCYAILQLGIWLKAQANGSLSDDSCLGFWEWKAVKDEELGFRMSEDSSKIVQKHVEQVISSRGKALDGLYGVGLGLPASDI